MSTSESAGEWDWITEFGDPWVLGFNGCITFARGVSERGMLTAFEMDPDSAIPMTPVEADTEIMETSTENGPFWVRVAEVDGWGIAMEWDELKGCLDNIAARASSGTESVVINTNIKRFGRISYFVDGIGTSAFSIGEGYDTRAGRDPNFFHDALASVGLGGLDDGTMENQPPMRRQIVGVLRMLTNTLGIRLPHDVFAGPLLTASRTERYFYQLPAQSTPTS